MHELLALGYSRLDSRAFHSTDEEAITGELVRAIRDACDDPASPKWVDHFAVHDDPRVDDGVRKGKHRLKVDIGFESSERRPRLRFPFEAKRLGPKHPVSVYLGASGLGCFLRGDYARDEQEAGMLGYVQSGDADDWATKIESELTDKPDAYGVRNDDVFSHEVIDPALTNTYRSRHDRPTVGEPISVYHTLLLMN